ncbi:MAG: DUF4129 domain-containing protein [Bowdeniella nasicola]|nr:DUF4129 domain-containing protein [Bowdeniella nasicola]
MWLLSIPVTPDADDARRLAQEELAKAIYHHEPGPIARILNAIAEVIGRLTEASLGTGSPWLSVVLVAVIVAGLVIALLLVSRVRVARRTKAEASTSAAVFVDDADSQALAERARDHARAGRYSDAFLDQFRSLIRYADERALIEDRPGFTAQEAARAVGALHPSIPLPLRAQADRFDAASYGDVHLVAQDFESLHRLDGTIRETLRSVRPAHAFESLGAS